MKYGALAQSVEHLTFNQVVRGSNPRCFIEKEKHHAKAWCFFFSLQHRGFALVRTTKLAGAHEVRGTSVLRRPKRSEERIPDAILRQPSNEESEGFRVDVRSVYKYNVSFLSHGKMTDLSYEWLLLTVKFYFETMHLLYCRL